MLIKSESFVCESKKNKKTFTGSLSLFRKTYLSTFLGPDDKVYACYTNIWHVHVSMEVQKICVAPLPSIKLAVDGADTQTPWLVYGSGEESACLQINKR